MPPITFTNPAELLARSSLSSANEQYLRSLQRLSSGNRVGIPGDDPAGLAVSVRMRADIRRTQAVQANVQNTLSYLQTQDGVLQIAASVVTRMSELATLAQDVTKGASDTAVYNAEFQQLQRQLLQLSSERFNGLPLFVLPPSTNTAASTTEELLQLPVTTDGTTLSISKPPLATNPWVNMLLNGFVSFADPADLTRRIFVPDPPQDLKGYLRDGSEFDLDQTTVVTQSWIEQFSLSAGWNSRAATNALGNPITVSASIASPGATSVGSDTFQLTNPQAPYVTQPTYRALAENFRNGTFIDPLHAGTTTTSSVNVTFSTATAGATLTTPSESVTLTSTLQAWTNNPLAATAANASSAALTRETATEMGAVAALALQSLAEMRASNGAQQSRLGYTTESLQHTATHLEAAVSRIADIDVAAESTELARLSILQQAAASVLAQANATHQTLMRLLFN
jgi:flagellin-like hook-associated protein FlgL